MSPDSALTNLATNEKTTVGDLYATIKETPFVADAKGILLRNKLSVEHHISKDGRQVIGDAEGQIYPDKLVLQFSDKVINIPLSELLYIDTEMNHKTRVATAENTYTVVQIGNGSALQWQDTLKKLVNDLRAA